MSPSLPQDMVQDKDAIKRMAACHSIALAYVGTNENRAIRKYVGACVVL